MDPCFKGLSCSVAPFFPLFFLVAAPLNTGLFQKGGPFFFQGHGPTAGWIFVFFSVRGGEFRVLAEDHDAWRGGRNCVRHQPGPQASSVGRGGSSTAAAWRPCWGILVGDDTLRAFWRQSRWTYQEDVLVGDEAVGGCRFSTSSGLFLLCLPVSPIFCWVNDCNKKGALLGGPSFSVVLGPRLIFGQ